MNTTTNLTNLSPKEIQNLPIETIALYNVEALKFTILPSGYQINKTNNNGQNLLHIYSKSGRITHVKLLLEKGLSPEIKDNYGLKPINYAQHKYGQSHGYTRTKYSKIIKLLSS